jgi:HEAT repeat protein
MLRPALTLLLLLLLPTAAAAQQPPSEDPLGRRVRELVRELAAEDYPTRAEAMRELEALGARTRPYLEAFLDSPDPEVARRVEQLIAGFANRELDDLLVPLGRQDNDFLASEEMDRIVEKGRKILPDLWQVIDEEDSHYPSYSYWRMKNAYAALGRIVDTRDLDRLLARLDHPNIQHRLLIRPILATLEKGLVRKRTKALLGDAKAAAQARAWLLDLCREEKWLREDPEFGELAKKMLTDPSPLARVAACRWFWLQRDPSVTDRIVKTAADENEEVRAAALRALRSYQGKNVAATLRNGLRDPVPEVRAAAIDTLRSVAGPDMAPLLRPFLKDPDPMVRSNAAQTLARLGDKGAVPVLVELLAVRDDEFLMRALHSVVSAVGTLGDPSALPALRNLLEDAAEYSRIDNYRYMILSSIV